MLWQLNDRLIIAVGEGWCARAWNVDRVSGKICVHKRGEKTGILPERHKWRAQVTVVDTSPPLPYYIIYTMSCYSCLLVVTAFLFSPNLSFPSTQALDIQLKVNRALLTSSKHPNAKLVGSIDQGTSSSRFLLFTSQGEVAASAQVELNQIFNEENEGWHEHSPEELWMNTRACMNAVGDAIRDVSVSGDDGRNWKLVLSAIGITNQRETTIAWNRITGEPYHNAIVWDDTRTSNIVKEIGKRGDNALFRDRTGLPIASYFAGSKVKWLLDNVEQLRRDVEDEERCKHVCFGTVDAWLLWKLTSGKRFATDVSNASRWLFMDLKTCQFDQELIDRICRPHKLPMNCLPEICPSSFLFGNVNADCGLGSFFENVPISGVLGDQQAALFGQTAFEKGQAKNTYGTGLFLMMNTGNSPVPSTHGLLTTVGYQLGTSGDVIYALEGSVSHSGSTIRWLRDQLHLIESASDAEKYAATTTSNQGLYLVPAFAGLFSPHWNSNARACIVGITAGHHRGHICRAAMEASCYQTKEVFDAITNESGVTISSLNVDGGATANKLMMQFQADMLDVPVVKPLVMETTALGAAFAAGLAVNVWKDLDEIKALWTITETFEPSMDESKRAKNWKGWNKAVQRSFDWIDEDGDVDTED